MEQVAEYNPLACIPDKAKKMLSATELLDAYNMRFGVYNPEGGEGIYQIAGFTILDDSNNAVPTVGTNKPIGWCADTANSRLFFALYNDEGNHSIIKWDETDGYRAVLLDSTGQGLLAFNSGTQLSIEYLNGYLAWTSIDITEPRQVNVERGINAFLSTPIDPKYLLPIDPWELYQIQRVPSVPLDGTNAINNIVYLSAPKPNTLATEEGYQFTYNYEFLNNIEGRMGPPTPCYWNPGAAAFFYLPSSEYTYLVKGGVPNPYVVAVRFYFRIGNTGEWAYFARVENNVDNLFAINVRSDDFDTLTAIGTPSLSALLPSDGIEPFVFDLTKADNRLIHGRFLSGNTFVPPTATLEVEYINIIPRDPAAVARGFLVFPPLNSQVKETALIYFDAQDRIIGGRILPNQTMVRTDQVVVKINTILASVPDYFLSGTRTFENVWNYVDWDSIIEPSTMDMGHNPAIKITPDAYSGGLPAPIQKVMLASKVQKRVSDFLRTQARVYFIYKFAGRFVVVLSTENQNFTVNESGQSQTWSFYGIGFDMNSEQPINFSNEQQYHIQIRGITTIDTPSTVRAAFLDKDFKITDQTGSIMISAQPFAAFANLTSAFGAEQRNWEQMVADVLLYSRDKSDKLWSLIPTVSWTRAEFIALTPRYYYGDCYITKDEKTISSSALRPAFQHAENSADQYSDWGVRLIPIFCRLTCASMNLNGIYLEQWDSNIGNSLTTINENPKQKTLLNTYRHGESFIPGTEINNIFTFDALNEDQTQSELGPIIKMMVAATNNANGNNLYIYHPAGLFIKFLGKTQQTGTDGESIMSLSTKVFGSDNVLRFTVGIKNKNQVVNTNRGLMFFWDETNNLLCMVGGEGIKATSMEKGFQSHCKLIADDACIGFNPLYNEIVVQSGGQGLAYNFAEDRYLGRRGFGVTGAGNLMFLWLSQKENYSSMFTIYGENGLLRKSDSGPIDVDDLDSSLTVVLNSAPLKNKEMISVAFSGSDGWSAVIGNTKGQETNIEDSEFVDSEGIKNSSVLRDITSTGGKKNGKPMEDNIQFITFNTKNEEVAKYFQTIGIGYIISQNNIGPLDK